MNHGGTKELEEPQEPRILEYAQRTGGPKGKYYLVVFINKYVNL